MSAPAEKILIIKLGALGDFIQSLGPMEAIRKHHPDAHITLLTTAPFESFAKQCGYADRVDTNGRPGKTAIANWLKLRKLLNSGFTRVYDLQNNDRTGFYFRLLKNPKPEWVGTAKGASHCNDSSDRTKGRAFDGHAQTLALAGIKNIKADDLSWLEGDLRGFSLQRPYVLIIAGSAPQHPYKRWPAQHYARFAETIARTGFQPVLLGTGAEAELNNIIARLCPGTLDLSGRTSLAQIAALARGAAFAIGNDTGPMHLVGATNCPCLVLFSDKSNPARHAPMGAAVKTLQRANLADLSPEEVIENFRPREEPREKATMR